MDLDKKRLDKKRLDKEDIDKRRLDDKVAIITGGASGMGLSLIHI